MMHAPVRLPDSIDHACSHCARVERAPTRQLPADWLLLVGNATTAIICDDCAPAARAAALAQIHETTRAIVRSIRPNTDDRHLAHMDASLSDDIGADELDRVAIAIECEDLFAIKIDDDEASAVATIGDLNRLIFAKTNHASIGIGA